MYELEFLDDPFYEAVEDILIERTCHSAVLHGTV